MTDPILARMTANGRFYYHPGRPNDGRPSITNIINMKSKPLFGAGMREAANYAADNVSRLAGLNREEVYKLVSNPPRREDSPSVIGDIVHNWIDRRVKGSSPSHEEVAAAPQTAKWMWNSFLKFEDYYKPEYTASEFTVWSDTYGYAGTGDLGLRINGLHVLVDTKTGKGVYPEAGMQVAAIQKADFILHPDGRQEPIPRYDRYAVLHIRPRSATLLPVENIEEAFQAFVALKRVFDWNATTAQQTIGFAPKIS